MSEHHRFRSAVAGRLLAVTCLGLSVALAAPGTASAATSTLVGAWSTDQAWMNSNVGQLEVYRGFQNFLPASWSRSGYSTRPGIVDYSFEMAPGVVAANRAKITGFVATTPKNLILSYFHEPEVSTTPEAFRAATRTVADIVHAQNAVDGGTRRYEVILMGWTFNPKSNRNPMDWWPGRDAAGRNYADIISEDVYSAPTGADTELGYTAGVNWRSAAQMFDPVIAFADQVGARWSVSEFGYLEDSTDPGHKARAITEAVAYAGAHNAVAIEYWNGIGPRADWRLLSSVAATTAFRQAVAAG